jgi:dienelactone hydrolase
VVAYLWFNPAFSPGDDKDSEIDILRHLTAELPPAIVFFGSEDGWKDGWDKAHAKWKSLGNPTIDLEVASGQSHGFFNRDPWRTVTLIAADRFLMKQGLLQGEPTLQPPATGEKLIPATENGNLTRKVIAK